MVLMMMRTNSYGARLMLCALLLVLVGALPATAQSFKAQQEAARFASLEPPIRYITPGQPVSFRLGPYSTPTLVTFRGDEPKVEVPKDATRVTFTLESDDDLELLVRFAANPDLQNGSVVTDYRHRNRAGNERIVITPQSTPPLQAGTYYVAIGVFTTGSVVEGTLTAEVEREPGGGGGNGEPVSRIHVFPQIADGGGWQSIFLVTNVSQSDSACTLRLQGLSVDRFPRISGVSAAGSTATFTLESGGYLVYRSTNQQALAAGYATLDCATPVEAQVLYVAKDASGATTGMATVFSSPAGTIFQFPVLALENRLAAAIANDTSTDASCSLVLEDHARVNQGEATFSVPAKSTVARFLDQVIALPGGSFTSGSATLTCDQQVSVIGLYVDGSLFTTLPPAILSGAPDSTPPPGGGGGQAQDPDLVVENVAVSDDTPETGESFTLRATVRNRGDGPSAATTLRYYRSSNSTISSRDTRVGTDTVATLAAGASGNESIRLTAPSQDGTYYYGACVDSVSGESNTGNNCSSGVRVSVSDGGGGGGGGGGGRPGECVEGKTYGTGEGCDVYGVNSSSKQRFTVLSDGRGRWGFITSGNRISNRGGSINGVRYHFVASHQGGGVWKVDEYRP